jgi:hypothetical protein
MVQEYGCYALSQGWLDDELDESLVLSGSDASRGRSAPPVITLPTPPTLSISAPTFPEEDDDMDIGASNERSPRKSIRRVSSSSIEDVDASRAMSKEISSPELSEIEPSVSLSKKGVNPKEQSTTASSAVAGQIREEYKFEDVGKMFDLDDLEAYEDDAVDVERLPFFANKVRSRYPAIFSVTDIIIRPALNALNGTRRKLKNERKEERNRDALARFPNVVLSGVYSTVGKSRFLADSVSMRTRLVGLLKRNDF